MAGKTKKSDATTSVMKYNHWFYKGNNDKEMFMTLWKKILPDIHGNNHFTMAFVKLYKLKKGWNLNAVEKQIYEYYYYRGKPSMSWLYFEIPHGCLVFNWFVPNNKDGIKMLKESGVLCLLKEWKDSQIEIGSSDIIVFGDDRVSTLNLDDNECIFKLMASVITAFIVKNAHESEMKEILSLLEEAKKFNDKKKKAMSDMTTQLLEKAMNELD